MTLAYPPARRLDLTENILGHEVNDPYRWLEDPATPESEAWLNTEEALWNDYRDTLDRREEFAARVTELSHVGTVSVPVWRAERRFFIRRDPGQDHGVLYVADGDDERALVDPAQLDPTGRTTLDTWQPDKEGRLVAYQVSSGGDEESILYVIDVASGTIVEGPIDRCRYSPVAWLPGGKAFYYTRKLGAGQVPAGEEQYHRRVYLHTVGTDPVTDVPIFGEGRDKTAFYGISVSRDGGWLILSESLGTAPRNDVWIASLTESAPDAPDLTELIIGQDAQTSAHVARDGRLYVLTDLDAPRTRLCVADPAAPGPDQWRDLVPQHPEAVLRGFTLLNDALLVSWTHHAIGSVTVHSLVTGDQVSELGLPGVGTVGGLTSRPEGGDEAWIGYSDYGRPSTVLYYQGGSLSVWATAPGAVELPPLEASQVTYTSADGTPVRMIVLSAPGAGSGPRPAILYGYGGFDISLTPGYSANILTWVEAGGVYAVAGLRGGGEEGQEWHRAGRRDKKQNVFDDFHAAAEWLISSGLTTSDQLAAWGGSNGGLLVGTAITQRPDLYAVAICSAPLLDMVRYERFGLGQLWNDEYGTASDPAELGWLLSYSPYHQVTPGVSYPAVLFTVFTNDTRVDPVHAYKMCAALQFATASDRPVLLRAEGEVGHGARAVRFAAALAGDALAFVAQQTRLSRDRVDFLGV
ncbi:MAG: prolyl oligopeptidase family serine peptidase [Streptosporangiaceae bacterium]|jgi:prolyl oligopeptidase